MKEKLINKWNKMWANNWKDKGRVTMSKTATIAHLGIRRRQVSRQFVSISFVLSFISHVIN
mgnify:CR=1 FL=1